MRRLKPSLLIYLNVRMPDDEAKIVEEFWERMLRNHELFVNLLVLDEVIYVSRRKYDVPFSDTLEFIDRAVLPHVEMLVLRLEAYLEARKYMIKYGLKPSDSIHAATVEVFGLQAIASEDRDFDKIGIKRLWV